MKSIRIAFRSRIPEFALSSFPKHGLSSSAKLFPVKNRTSFYCTAVYGRSFSPSPFLTPNGKSFRHMARRHFAAGGPEGRGNLNSSPGDLSEYVYDENVDIVVKQFDPDGVTRYPEFTSPQGLLRTFDWVGTISFAMTGTICAGVYGMDYLGCVIVGTITATGGGTIRDMLLGNTPVSLIMEIEYLWMCIITALLTLFFWEKLQEVDVYRMFDVSQTFNLLWWTDTLGLGAFACIGVQNGIRRGLNPFACIALSLLTCTGGGITRDVLVKRDVRIMHSHAELYASSALVGATSYVAARALGAIPAVRVAAGAGATVGMRYWATKDNIKLPLASWFDRNPEAKPVYPTPYTEHNDHAAYGDNDESD